MIPGYLCNTCELAFPHNDKTPENWNLKFYLGSYLQFGDPWPFCIGFEVKHK